MEVVYLIVIHLLQMRVARAAVNYVVRNYKLLAVVHEIIQPLADNIALIRVGGKFSYVG